MSKTVKLFHFSDKSLLEKYDELSSVKSLFQVSNNTENWSPEEVLTKDFDVIELEPGDFSHFAPFFKALDIKISRMGVADALVKKGSIWHPVNLLSDAVYSSIVKKVPKLKIAEPAVVIGAYDFVLAMAQKLAQSGFLKIIVALENETGGEKIKSILNHFVFGVEIDIISLEELTQLESSNGLLVINLLKENNPEAHESITYFNFLSPNAVFVDLQSRNENSLVEEARRAELIVVGEVEILKTKYLSLTE